MSTAALIISEFARCALARLIVLANDELPPGLKDVPNPGTLSGSECVRLIDIYSSFLRTPRKPVTSGHV